MARGQFNAHRAVVRNKEKWGGSCENRLLSHDRWALKQPALFTAAKANTSPFSVYVSAENANGERVFVDYSSIPCFFLLLLLLFFGRFSPLTDLQYVVHPAALQQSDTPQERQLSLVIIVPARSTFLPAGVEGRIHTDLLLAPRERPVYDPPLDGLRDPLEPLLHPLERPLLRDSARRDVEQRFGVVRLPVSRHSRGGPSAAAAARDSSSPLPLPTRRVVAGPAAEPLGRGLLDSLGHDRTASDLKRSSSPII